MSKGYQEGTDYIFKKQGKFKTQIFGNVTIKGIRKGFFLIMVEKNLSTNTDHFGFFPNKVLVDPENPRLPLFF